MFMYCVDVSKDASLLPGCPMLIGCCILLRSGKEGYQPRSDGKKLCDESATWHPNFESPQEISMKVDAFKHKQMET